MDKMKLADNIVRFRRERKLTQEELADFLGVTKASVSKWEKGINTPDIQLLPRLAAYFAVTVDELIGYEAYLSPEQIRRRYRELTEDFAALPFGEALEKVRSLAHRYYADSPLLLQLGILYLNHYMLADTREAQEELLQEASGWCQRILENSGDVGLCSDALALRTMLQLMMGRAADAIETLEPVADPCRLAQQNGSLLIQAYQMAGEAEKARSFAQVKHYLDMLDLINDGIQALSLSADDMAYCEETIRRAAGVLALYKVEALHPNQAAQFYYQAAVVYGLHGKNGEALDMLRRFGACVDALYKAEVPSLHGDSYFHLLDAWIERLPLGGMAPRDRSFITSSLREAFSHPAFDGIKETAEFQGLMEVMKII